ncbi:DUF2946 family protein [Vitreimonas sp.]|uniref:DUF2946 family protein n=1 Tax=Vitreimonas sp. TaxID=3069702 RepID=UPI002ED8928B
MRRPAAARHRGNRFMTAHMARGGFLQRIYTAGLTLALFALTFKALLPPGFMLAAQGDTIAITLCNGGEAFFDARTGAISHDEAPASDDTSQHCPFAAVAAPTLVEVATAPAVPTFAFVEVGAPKPSSVGVWESTGPPLPARGPPLQA